MTDDAKPDWYRPPRGYQWETFTEGNVASLRHGCYSPRMVRERADQLEELLPDDVLDRDRYLQDGAYRAEMRRWLEAEAEALMWGERLDRVGWVDEEGEPRERMLRQRSAALARAAKGRDALGLSPLSRARLGRDVAGAQVDVVRAFAALATEDAEKAPAPPSADSRPQTGPQAPENER